MPPIRRAVTWPIARTLTLSQCTQLPGAEIEILQAPLKPEPPLNRRLRRRIKCRIKSMADAGHSRGLPLQINAGEHIRSTDSPGFRLGFSSRFGHTLRLFPLRLGAGCGGPETSVSGRGAVLNDWSHRIRPKQAADGLRAIVERYRAAAEASSGRRNSTIPM
jgi:hypothetical protein